MKRKENEMKIILFIVTVTVMTFLYFDCTIQNRNYVHLYWCAFDEMPWDSQSMKIDHWKPINNN